MNLPDQQRLFRAFLFSLLAGIALYAVSVALSDLRAVGAAMGALGWWGWSAVLALSLVNYGLRFGRWQWYLGRLGHHTPAGASALYYLAGFSLTTTPGKAGEAVRSLYLKRHGVGYADSLAALFVERLVDLVAMVLLAALAVAAFEQTRLPVAVLVAAVLVLLPLLRSPAFHAWMGRRANGLRRAALRTALGHLLGMLERSARLLANRPLYAGLAVGLVAWGAEGFGFYLILGLMGMDVTLTLAVGVYAVSVLVGALSFLPGGLGSTEAAMALMLTLLGADLATAVSATLVCRLATLWFAVAIGLGCLAAIELPRGRSAPSGGI